MCQVVFTPFHTSSQIVFTTTLGRGQGARREGMKKLSVWKSHTVSQGWSHESNLLQAELCPRKKNHTLTLEPPVCQNVIVFGESVFKEIIQLK